MRLDLPALLGAQLGARPCEQRPFGSAFDVGSDQHGAIASSDMQHAAAVVVLQTRIIIAFGSRMQHFELHAIPLPALAGNATLRDRRRCIERVRSGQRTQRPRHGQRREYRASAAGVIEIIVTDHQHIQVAHAFSSQEWHHDALSGIAATEVPWAGIEQQRMVSGPGNDGEALSNIEHRDPRFALGRGRRMHQKQRQHLHHPCPSSRKATRQKQPRGPEKRGGNRPRRRGVLLPGRAGRKRQPLQKGHAQGHDCVRQLRHGIHWNDDGKQRKRCNDKAYQRDCHRVGERRNHRNLLKQRQQHRDQRHGHCPLRSRPCSNPPRLADPAGARQGNRGDRTERQPESRRAHRHRIEQRNQAQRKSEHGCDRPAPPAPERNRHYGEHEHRALCRDCKPRQRRVRDRSTQPCGSRHRHRRNAAGQRSRPPPDRSHQRESEARDHRNVQARDAHQMVDAGSGEKRPLLARNCLLVANRQCDHDSAVGLAFERRQQPNTHVHATTRGPAGRECRVTSGSGRPSGVIPVGRISISRMSPKLRSNAASLFTVLYAWMPLLPGVSISIRPANRRNVMSSVLVALAAAFGMMALDITGSYQGGSRSSGAFLLEGQVQGVRSLHDLIEEGKDMDEIPAWRLPVGQTNKDVCG